MPEIVRDIAMSETFARDARQALRDGAPILCDAKMVANGGQIGSVGIEGFSVSYNPQAGAGSFNNGAGYTLPPSATARLAPYINMSRYFGV